MLALLGGVAILGGLLLLVYLFVNADPARLAGNFTRNFKWIVFGLSVVLSLVLLFSGRIAIFWLPVGLALPYLWPQRFGWRGQRTGGSQGGSAAEVTTPYLRMRLDRASGAIGGTVLAGAFAGMQLDELGFDDLLSLLRECRTADEEGARLLEAYLDRLHPAWRQRFAGEPPRSAAGSSDIGVAQAYEILGLRPGADEAAIRAAHHRLIRQLHPDHGGSEYFASQINRARDVLLKRR